MSAWGGPRPGSGRPKGSQSASVKKRRAVQREISNQVVAKFQADHPDAFPGDSLDFLRCVFKNPDVELSVRIDAAGKAVRFEHPTAVITQDLTPTPNADDILARLVSLTRKGLLIDARPDLGRDTDGAGAIIDVEPEREG
jgi:hypothetical protein